MLTSRVRVKNGMVKDGWITIKGKEDGEKKYRRIFLDPKGIIKGGDVPKEVQGTKIGSKENKEALKKVAKKEAASPKTKSVNKETKKETRKEAHFLKTTKELVTEISKVVAERGKQKSRENKQLREFTADLNRIFERIRAENPGLSHLDLFDIRNKDPEYISIVKKQEAYKEEQRSKPKKPPLSKVVFDMLELPEVERTNFELWSSVQSKVIDECVENINRIVRNIPRWDRKGNKIRVAYRQGERSSHRKGLIILGKISRKDFYHEVGHDLEERIPMLKNKCRAFLVKRTQGEKTVPLREFSKHYNSDEHCKPDKFLDPYMGKLYPSLNTEILSMGLQYLFECPEKFIKGDPEYFEFIVSALRGE